MQDGPVILRTGRGGLGSSLSERWLAAAGTLRDTAVAAAPQRAPGTWKGRRNKTSRCPWAQLQVKGHAAQTCYATDKYSHFYFIIHLFI